VKTIPASIIAVCSLLLGGCFSAAVRYGEGWNGDTTPTGHKVAAGVADAATLPLQAPFLITAGANAGSRSHATKLKNKKLGCVFKIPDGANPIWQRWLQIPSRFPPVCHTGWRPGGRF
jgi:hypothetical protein